MYMSDSARTKLSTVTGIGLLSADGAAVCACATPNQASAMEMAY